MSDANLNLVELAQKTEAGAAAAVLAGFGAYGGGVVKSFMPPLDTFASWACFVALVLGIIGMVAVGARALFKRA